MKNFQFSSWIPDHFRGFLPLLSNIVHIQDCSTEEEYTVDHVQEEQRSFLTTSSESSDFGLESCLSFDGFSTTGGAPMVIIKRKTVRILIVKYIIVIGSKMERLEVRWLFLFASYRASCQGFCFISLSFPIQWINTTTVFSIGRWMALKFVNLDQWRARRREAARGFVKERERREGISKRQNCS